MLSQAIDFREESQALYELLEPLDDAAFDAPSQFKGWTINNVLGHLHTFNVAADLSVHDADGFQAFIADLGAAGGMRPFEEKICGGLKGQALVKEWHDFFVPMAERFEGADPKRRVKWVGPDMSVRSSITARLMETWSHGQEVYDMLGARRTDGDRIKNIAVLGVNTFGWTYINRKMEVPVDVPYIKLTAPSGEVWEWNDPTSDNKIEGAATDFCQVVTQVRNIGDVNLEVTGPVATEYMSFAQCFAGPPETPPATGTRFCKK